jgi:hypothetical protein
MVTTEATKNQQQQQRQQQSSSACRRTSTRRAARRDHLPRRGQRVYPREYTFAELVQFSFICSIVHLMMRVHLIQPHLTLDRGV